MAFAGTVIWLPAWTEDFNGCAQQELLLQRSPVITSTPPICSLVTVQQVYVHFVVSPHRLSQYVWNFFSACRLLTHAGTIAMIQVAITRLRSIVVMFFS
jgi:hypothetical protein